MALLNLGHRATGARRQRRRGRRRRRRPNRRRPRRTPTEESVISDEEGRELLQSVVDFTETLVREVMTPRPDIVAIRRDASLQDLRALFREEQYSRMPVYRDNLDNIVGVVFVKDLVALPPRRRAADHDADAVAPYFVPESKRVSELLKDMQRRQAQMAIVVDEYGGTAGLVTVEDLLEEIVGEIRDEYDVESETVTDEGHGVVRLQRQGQRGRGARAPRRRDRARRLRDGRRLPAGRSSAACRTSGRRSRSTSWRWKCSKSSGAASPRCASARAGESPRSGQRRCMKAGFVVLRRPAQRRQVHAAQPHRRPEAGHRVRQAADDAHPRSSA